MFYAFKIELYSIRSKGIYLNEKTDDYIKVVQFSDVHIKEDFTYENFAKVVKCINEQQPDIVVFTGDLYDNYGKYNDDANIIRELQKINVKYDKIAIWGNRDYGGGAARHYKNIMEQSGFIVLKNENEYVTTDKNKKILFTGLDDSMLGNASMPTSTKIYESDYNIILTHEPDIADFFQEYNYNLVLGGHSHGGQINIPFIPAINRKAVSLTSHATKYTSGLYEINSNTKIYVNTGIGTTHISARFGVIPEISVFYIFL
ncbi:MAG: metallophosphoesterase [Lachnospirales bacterium]